MQPSVIEVHCINSDATDQAEDLALATPEERSAAERFRQRRDARHFLARRAATRRLLSLRLGIDIGAITVSHGPFGKPYLRDSRLCFSVSQAGPLALIVIADDLPLGCDIEQVTPLPDLLAIAADQFTPAEYARLEDLSEHARIDAFFDCWTRKEAYLKAVGTGMSLPMYSFEFLPGSGSVASLDDGSVLWSSTSWVPAAGYRAAIVAAGDKWTIDRGQAVLRDTV